MNQRHGKIIHLESLRPEDDPDSVENKHTIFSLKNILIGGGLVGVVAVSLILVFVYRDTIFSSSTSNMNSTGNSNSNGNSNDNGNSNNNNFKPKGDRLVFYVSSKSGNGNGILDLCSVDSNGSSSVEKLIPGPIRYKNMNLSFDGKKVVYEERGNIYTENIDGSEKELVLDGVKEKFTPKDPSFSPTGDKIVFVNAGLEPSSEDIYGTKDQIVIIDSSDGQNIQKLTEASSKRLTAPVFTSDGNHIVALDNDPSTSTSFTNTILMIDSDTGKVEKSFILPNVNRSIIFISAFSISPDGKKLAVSFKGILTGATDTKIQIINTDEEEREAVQDAVTIYESEHNIVSLCWSSDGNYIYFIDIDLVLRDRVLARKRSSLSGDADKDRVEYLKDKDGKAISGEMTNLIRIKN